MNLNILWFILITVLFSGFFFLEGFDYGVGMMLPFIGRNEKERKMVIAAIGPFWDGNEVWLITAGGAIFAAFPQWYATMFSGFYLALVLLLVALIVRGIALEFRNKEASLRWRTFWDWATFGSSSVAALLWGVALTNIIEGVPIDQNMEYVGGFFNLLNPFALLGGIATVLVFALHGSIFLSLKTSGAVADRAGSAAKRMWLPAVLATTLFIIIGYFSTDVFSRLGVNPGVAPIVAGAAILAAGYFIYEKEFGWAFIMMGTFIVLSTVSGFLGLFPRVMVSSLNSTYSLTIYNASSSQYTLHAMTIVAFVMVPIVLVYQGWSYYIFRKRVTEHTVY